MNRSSTLAILVLASSVVLAADAQPSRQQEVARKGATVMPFDLDRTQHFFDDRPTGGVETVLANDKGDATQVELIRSHLRGEALRFSRGDFSDPASIHGADMPGLKKLAAAGDTLQVAYNDVPAGASLTFAATDPQVVAAIHQWFATQRRDHGAHRHLHQ